MRPWKTELILLHAIPGKRKMSQNRTMPLALKNKGRKGMKGALQRVLAYYPNR